MRVGVLDRIGGPAAWLGEEMRATTAWRLELNEAQQAELRTALATDRGITPRRVAFERSRSHDDDVPDRRLTGAG